MKLFSGGTKEWRKENGAVSMFKYIEDKKTFLKYCNSEKILILEFKMFDSKNMTFNLN